MSRLPITSFENIHNFDDLLNAEYGPVGSPVREAFEAKADAFRTGEMLKEARRQAKLTQQQLADKTGTKKSYISRIENGHSDINLATLRRIVQQGLGRRVTLHIE
ncbi:helix-turn-helix domain-containing protein [Hymenobacter caeli]|uniref:DNA-binding XRE family transcriptional regulator n=1 Tax=Hymenobacter caeli TaxID=2735894 RepID=A0ABX2FMQ3_9BACT|nr:helix-turn-helix transcriptional regulator [Hymenobacter caeli]NRT17750.1 DNA-binding XRE family transcriptional regulator [Hymenobacter caeli]